MNPGTALLQFGFGSSDPLIQLLVLVVAIGLVVLVGRVVLKVAWRLVTIAAVIIGLLIIMTVVLPGVL